MAGAAAIIGAASIVLAGAGTAMAAQTYTITAGGQTSPSPVAYTASDTDNEGIQFWTPNVDMSCTEAHAAGDLELGTVTGPQVGTIDDTDWIGCLGPLDIPMTVEPTHPWSLNLTGPANTVTEGYIGGVVADVSATDDPNLCSFHVEGEAYGNFDESTQTLNVVHDEANAGNVDNPLTISNVTGCFGLIAEGDPAYFTGEYVVSNDLGPIDIS